MSKFYSTTVSLRIGGDDLDPEEITKMLGRSPTHSHRKGDRISKRVATLRKSGMWSVAADWQEGGHIEARILDILASLPNDIALWAAIAERYAIDFYCGAHTVNSNPGFDLEASTIAMLASRSIAFRLSIYVEFPEAEDGAHALTK